MEKLFEDTDVVVAIAAARGLWRRHLTVIAVRNSSAQTVKRQSKTILDVIQKAKDILTACMRVYPCHLKLRIFLS